MGIYVEGDKKYYCGLYKGLAIYQVGQIIGTHWYGYFYVAKKREKNYVKIKNSESKTLSELKDKIEKNNWAV